MQWREFKEKAYNGIYKARWYPRIYLPNCQPILVYTPAKTGTTTLRNTLYRHDIGPAFWAHSMNRARTKEYHKNLAQSGIKPVVNPVWQNRILERYIEKDRPIKIITSVRNPIDRDISGFFQRFEHRNKVSVNQYTERFDDLYEMLFDEIRQRTTSISWFEHEYQEVLGLNIYDHPFPHEDGYQILQHKQFEILLLKIETPDEIKEKALSEFFNTSNIKMYRTNIGAEKDYKDTYRDFRQFIKLPQDYIDSSYESPTIQHFYTADEIAQFRSKWTVL